MRCKKLFLVLALLFLFVGLSASLASANGALEVRWWVMGGGGEPLTAANLRLEGTIGQPLVGTADAGGLTLRSGYWPGVPGFSTRLLPYILKVSP